MSTRADSLGGARPHTGTVGAVPRSARVRAGFAWVEREAFPITIAALYAIALLLLMPGELVQDSWATLVAGREIVQQGLPHHETLTVMAHGVRWIDQQWLAQLTFYELFRAGGYRLILFVHVFLIVAAFGLGIAAARRRGASAESVFLVALVCFLVAPWAWQLRAQSFAPLLFVGVLWLLVEDGRVASRRVFATLPLLALWANLHGSVVLGASLVALYGAVCLAERGRHARLHGAALVVLAPLTVVCSPYGFSLLHYYRRLLVNPPFGKLVTEWTAPTPKPITAAFYVLAFVTAWAVGRWGRRLTWFERLALLVTLASSLTATRNILWFGLTALVLLPVLIDAGLRSRTGMGPARRLAIVCGSVAGVVAAASFVVAKPQAWYDHMWHGRALAAVSAATRDPSSRVFASDRYADWLLWRDPRLAGRVAFDIRFELESRAQVRSLYDYFGRIGPNWQAAARGYRVLVLDRASHERVRLSLLRNRTVTQTYIDRDLAVLVRSGGPG